MVGRMSCPVCGCKQNSEHWAGIHGAPLYWTCEDCGESCRQPERSARAAGGMDLVVGLAVLATALCAVLVCLT